VRRKKQGTPLRDHLKPTPHPQAPPLFFARLLQFASGIFFFSRRISFQTVSRSRHPAKPARKKALP